MKLLKSEFESQLALAKTLPDEQRKTMLTSLKSAEVYEKAEDGTETKVEVEIIDQASAQPAVDQKAIDAAVAKALDAKMAEAKAATKAPISPVITVTDPIPVKCYRPSHMKAFTTPEIGGRKQHERAYRFGMWSIACRGNAKAMEWCNDHGLGLKVHNESDNTAGGFLVPEEFSADLIDLKEKYGMFRQFAGVVPMSRDSLNIPRRSGGLTAYWTGENSAATESTKSWDNVQLIAKKLTVLTRMSNELSEDALISVADDLLMEITQADTYAEDNAGWNGDGTSTYGGINGVITKISAVYTSTSADAAGAIIATGNLYSEVTTADLTKLMGKLPLYANTPNTAWYCSQAVYGAIFERLTYAQGGATTTELVNGVPVPRFAGRPIRISQVLSSTAANSQVPIVYGDLSLAAKFGDRRQETITFSDHATVGGQSVFERDQVAIRATSRVDINVHDVGTSSAAGPLVMLRLAAS